MSDLFRFAQLQPYSLAGAGAIIGDTSITLKSMTDIDGNALTMSGTFGDIGFGTLEPGNGSQEEQISFTGLVNNSNGTVTLTGVKNVEFTYPYTQTSGLSKTHPGSSTFIISNTAGFYDKLTSKSDDETITGTWTFDAVPNTTQDPVDGNDITRRSWVLSQINGGAVSTDSVIVSGVAGETLSAGNLVYLSSSDGRWYKTDADTASTVNAVELGTAQGAGTTGNNISSGVLIRGVDSTNTSLTPGSTYYASNTAGAISTSPGTNSRAIGLANSAGKLVLDPYFRDIPTDSQKDALIGGGYLGTPSSSNKFVTETGAAIIGKVGNGSDGALTITSGTTTIDLLGAKEVVKNYTSISITGTGKLAFSNPHANGTTIVLKSQGDVTCTSSASHTIDVRQIGAVAGTGAGSPSSDGTDGTDSTSWLNNPTKGLKGTGGTNGSGGVGGTAGTGLTALVAATSFASGLVPIVIGAGGGGGGSGGSNGGSGGPGGNGGRGGGALVIICGGAFNFTTGDIDASGTNGSNGTSPIGNGAGGGAGGGGGGGSVFVLYNTLTANSGSINVAGGTGGSGGGGSTPGSQHGGGGGGGGGSNSAGTNGSNESAGSGGAGGNGGAGLSIVASLNTFV